MKKILTFVFSILLTIILFVPSFAVTNNSLNVCNNCKQEIKGNSSYCSSCGIKFIDESFVHKRCGNSVNLDDNYCDYCGKEIDKNDITTKNNYDKTIKTLILVPLVLICLIGLIYFIVDSNRWKTISKVSFKYD